MKGVAMHLVQDEGVQARADVQGLAGWLLGWVKGKALFAGARSRNEKRHMRVVEALPMGPKRHLYLVSCDGERFLVGAGPESVQTIVRVRPQSTRLGLICSGEDA